MKKKIVFFVLLLLACLGVGCGSKEASVTEGSEEEKGTRPVMEQETAEEIQEEKAETAFDLALITGGWDSILDGEKYQDAWNGLVSYAEKEGISHRYYGAEIEEKEALKEQIQKALYGGAKYILGVGLEMQKAVEEMALLHPETQFCVLDAAPAEDVAANVSLLEFDKMEAGYVAGYTAAAEGYDAFGFFSYGEMLENEYEYGFLQGLEAAGKYLTRKTSKVYTVSFGAAGDEETMKEALGEWFEKGVQLVFCCKNAQALCSQVAAEQGACLVTAGEENLLRDLPAVNGVITRNYEKAVWNYLEGMYGPGHHYLEMGDSLIDFVKKEGVFASISPELEAVLIEGIEKKEDTLNRNTKISAAALRLEYVEFAY